MAQLKSDEWPTDKEPTTTETEVPAGTQSDHDAATERAQAVMRDRLDQFPPVEQEPDEKPTSR
jgi:hypothetical protein